MLLQPAIGGELDGQSVRGVDKSAGSLGHAVQICLGMHRERADP
jgi:transketolase N-terminal domain/subunit